MVTNPSTRDWSVTASLFATLNDMFGNRTVCGIGRGDSARRVIGQTPACLATLSEAMHVIKELAEGSEVKHPARPYASRGCATAGWRSGWPRTARRRCGWSASRPTASSCRPPTPTSPGGRSARCGTRPSPPAATRTRSRCAWPRRPTSATNLAHQRDQLRWFGGMVGNHVADLVARYGDSGVVPKALTDYIKGREGYDYAHHGRAGNRSTDFVPDAIVDRFCLLGPESAHVDRLQELAEIGVDNFALYLMHDDKEKTLAAYGKNVITHV